MKKIIVACDSYKGCLTSREVNEAMAEGVKSEERRVKNSLASSDAPFDVLQLEMSDGGEGMLDAFLSAMHGERVTIHAHDALMRWIEADYGIVGKAGDANDASLDEIAIVEIAQTAGLALIEPEQRNPMKATSWGVGEMILHAYRHGIRKFIVGLGGSATSDCGIGMLKAMGDDWKKIRKDCSFVLASDVTNPLCGPQGAAHVFAPQKGASEEMVEALDAHAKRFAEVLLESLHFDELLKDAALVITGEGHSDEQTLMGKLPQRILEHVLKYRDANNAPSSLLAEDCKSPEHSFPLIWLVSGGVSNQQALLDAGFDRVIAVTPKDMPLQEAMKPEVARENITHAISFFLKKVSKYHF